MKSHVRIQAQDEETTAGRSSQEPQLHQCLKLYKTMQYEHSWWNICLKCCIKTLQRQGLAFEPSLNLPPLMKCPPQEKQKGGRPKLDANPLAPWGLSLLFLKKWPSLLVWFINLWLGTELCGPRGKMSTWTRQRKGSSALLAAKSSALLWWWRHPWAQCPEGA